MVMINNLKWDRMEKQNKVNNGNRFRMILSILIANGIRLLRIIPNNDPIMSMALPYSRRSSALTSFVFPLITMVSFDFVTNLLGSWTLVTAITYGLIGLIFHYYLKGKDKVGMKTYLGCGVLGVLGFDFVTGVLATPIMFGMTVQAAFMGQIPFTAMHLLTTCAFILVVTPLLDKQVLINARFDDSRVWAYLSRLSINV
jgi:uncharacterized membrane protein YuzA (DUF378 family)